MRIQAQADTFARRIAGMGWRDGVHTSEADTPDGHRLMVRYPWEENPHYEWQHHHGEGRPVTGIANSLDEGKAAAEQSHKDLTGAWDPDAEQDALDPRLLGASRWYVADLSDEEKRKKLEDLGLFSDEANEFYDTEHNAPENWKSKYLSDPAFMEHLYQHSTTPPDRFTDNDQWQHAYNWDRTKPERKEKLRQDSQSRDPGAYHPWSVDQGHDDGSLGDYRTNFWEEPSDFTELSLPDSEPFQTPKHLMPQVRTNSLSSRFARQYFATTDFALDQPLDPGEDKKPKQPPVAGGTTPSGTSPGLNEGNTPTLPPPSPKPMTQYVQPGGGGMGGGSMPSSSGPGGAMPSSSGGGAGVSGHPDGGPPSQSLTEALTRAGIDPAMHPLISGFSATEGNNPSGAPTLGFTDSQAGTTLDSHAQALAQQLKDRQSVAGPFPHGGSPADQASWMATVVGQNGSQSDWQGNAQPARSDYVNRVVKSMPGAPPKGT